MLDIGFSEILVIAGLSLVVLGPDKLPRVVRTVGRWAGRARAMARQFSEQLAAEADNLKVDLDTRTDSQAPPGRPDSAAAAAAAAAPVPPAEFTGAPMPPAGPPTEPQAVLPDTTYPSANDSGHADLSQAEPQAGAPPAAPAEEPYDPANPPIPKTRPA